MKTYYTISIVLLSMLLVLPQCTPPVKVLEGGVWEKLTLTFSGPDLKEDGEDNPFLDYRLQVIFRQGEHTIDIPGFYAADGNAAESSASSGSIWKVHFRPDRAGTWEYEVSFKKGEDISINEDPQAGEAIAFDGEVGKIEVSGSANDHPGRLAYVGGHYQQYVGSGEYYLKGGADSPENFLAYKDFDGTYRYTIENRSGEAPAKEGLHHYNPHLGDWKTGDPTWQGGKGKTMIGALNYLASKGMNAVYMLSMNIEGDGKDVFPYISHQDYHHFDCSKLDQWEIVFDHMDQLGLMIHIVLQETENELLLDNGNTTFDRKLYYREMIARFAHHPMITWNMGEENGPAPFTPEGQNIAQREAMIKYFSDHDPYQNLVVIHSHSETMYRDPLFDPHLGNPDLDGMSVQVSDKTEIHEVIKHWLEKSDKAGRPWVMNMDEIGRHYRGVDNDARPDNNQDSVRAYVLWATLLAGGAGVEWYFGYNNPHNDLGCEDWRSRDQVWDFTNHALRFFHDHLPFWQMKSHDELLDNPLSYCFATPGEIYAIYIPKGQQTTLDLSNTEGTYNLQWYDPRNGGKLIDDGQLTGATKTTLKRGSSEEDWVALVKKQ